LHENVLRQSAESAKNSVQKFQPYATYADVPHSLCNTIQYDTIRYHTMQYNAIQYNTLLYNTM